MTQINRPTCALATDQVDVWYVRSDEVIDPALLEQYHRLMSPDERVQELRYHFAADRHLYRLGRALVRTSLSRYWPREPAAWAFVKNQYGRPDLANADSAGDLSFNLSHTAGLVACAVARGREVGIDVEGLDRRDVGPQVARRFFSPAEVAALAAMPAESQKRGFFRFWTLKESYIKARGMGLSLPLEQFSFDLAEEQSIAISFAPTLDDRAERWQFLQTTIDERYLLAVAASRAVGETVRFTVRETVPLSESVEGER